jgi:predicted hydrocarbon binding protein
MHPTPALIPLSLLEAVQNIDTPADDGLGALEQELAAKRLGLSPTVAAQVARYRRQVRAGSDVAAEDVLAIFRLVGRRPDAALVYADAGRRAARYAAKRRSIGQRIGIAAAPGKFGVSLALRASARIGQRWLGADLRTTDGRLRCEMHDTMALQARDDGAACQFYTSAFAELLRQVGGLEWSVTHELCCGRGDRHCLWRAMRAEGYE